MGEAGDVEGCAPVAVTVLPQVEIVAGAMQPDRQQADATPVVEPTVDERQLGRLSLDSVAASAARRRPATDFTAVFPEGAWPKSSSRWKGRVPQKPMCFSPLASPGKADHSLEARLR